jgi:hypothetical protein
MAMKPIVFGMLGLVNIAGCMVSPRYLPDSYSVSRLADGRLSIALAPEKYEQLGGKGSSEVNSFIAAAVAKEGACPDGFTTVEPMPVRGYVHIVVTCKAKGE